MILLLEVVKGISNTQESHQMENDFYLKMMQIVFDKVLYLSDIKELPKMSDI